MAQCPCIYNETNHLFLKDGNKCNGIYKSDPDTLGQVTEYYFRDGFKYLEKVYEKDYQIAEHNFYNRFKDGYSFFFYPNGFVKEKTPYKAGKKHGKAEYYYESGLKSVEKNYNMDSVEGNLRMWFENGNLEFEANYINNTSTPDGIATKYFENGLINYKVLTRQGRLLEVLECNNPQGKKLNCGTLRNGNGTYISYEFIGNVEYVLLIENYKNGLKDGVSIMFKDYTFDTLSITTYKKGALNGPFKYFNVDSKVSQSGSYLNGKLDGDILYYDSSSKLYRNSLWDYGKFVRDKEIKVTSAIEEIISRKKILEQFVQSIGSADFFQNKEYLNYFDSSLISKLNDSLTYAYNNIFRLHEMDSIKRLCKEFIVYTLEDFNKGKQWDDKVLFSGAEIYMKTYEFSFEDVFVIAFYNKKKEIEYLRPVLFNHNKIRSLHPESYVGYYVVEENRVVYKYTFGRWYPE